MRVALVSHNARSGDAIGNLVADKLALFLDRGAEVRVLVESTAGLHPRVRPHAQVMRAEPAGPGWEFLADADLVCVEFGHWYELLGLLPLLTPGKPRILLDYHSITPPEYLENRQREAMSRGRQQRGLAWAADLTVVHSRFTARELMQATGIPEERLGRLGFSVDLERFHPGAAGAWKHKLGLEHARVLLFVGRLAPNKRVPVLVEALSRLSDLDPPVHAVIIGDTGDIYQAESERCRRLSHNLGVAERVHFLGHVSDEDLTQAYRGADVFVMPSVWEGFCIPVLEAMASGVPVVAARAGALPETVANVGLTFRPDDAADLAKQLRRVFERRSAGAWERGSARALERDNVKAPCAPALPRSHATHHSPKRVAIVSMRYGDDFAGGAEWSLRLIASALHEAGNHVEVFTTCTRSESQWSNELPAATTAGTVPVHRFRIGTHDRARHLDSVRAILENGGNVSAEIERAYLDHALHSPDLIEALRQRQDQFDGIIVGPYLTGLTWDVARAFPEKTLLLPCFHDEPIARLAAWTETYPCVAGVLYHSPEEQELAQSELGLNHPNGVVIGTCLNSASEPERPAREVAKDEGRPSLGARARTADRYVVYCGRYSQQKELPTLLDYARRYGEAHPGRFTFVFMGQGEIAIPAAPWARNLGFASGLEKHRVLAGADALIQLSHFESLSLVALEAWSVGTPVIASRSSAVLAGHIERGGGGQTVADYETFAAAVDDLWERPAAWHIRGQKGQEYVRVHYGSLEQFQKRLEDALAGMTVPLHEQMSLQGLRRAAHFNPAAWREHFSALAEHVLHAPPRLHHDHVEIRFHKDEIQALPRGDLLIGVRLTNRGTQPLWAEGPGRTSFFCQVQNPESREPLGAVVETPLPAMLAPGQATQAALALRAPDCLGRLQVLCWLSEPERQARGTENASLAWRSGSKSDRQAAIALVVGDHARDAGGFCAPLLESVQSILAEAHRRQRLPDDYIDVSDGFLARCKRWLKHKLLNNFKRAYVDVLSRQQSQVNQQLVSAVQELAECCATLDHAVRVLQERLTRLETEVRGQKSEVRGQRSEVRGQK